MRAFGFDDCVLYVRQGNVLTQMSATGPKHLGGWRIADRIALAFGQGLVGSVAESGQPEYLPDVEQDPRYVRDLASGASEYAVPILYAGEVVGVLDSESTQKSGFSAVDRARMDAIAQLVGEPLGMVLERRSLAAAQRLAETAGKLARLPSIGLGALSEALPEIVEQAATALNAARVNVWSLKADELACLAHYELDERRHGALPPLDLNNYPRYRNALEDERVIIANEALHDARTAELVEGYLQPNRITAMLDAPIRMSEQVAGVVCVEHTQTDRRWTAEEAGFVASLGDFVAMAMLSSEKASAERALMQAQKWESLGRMASGVAHDFNNLLTIVGSSVDAIEAQAGLAEAQRELLQTIRNAGMRARVLTKKLLALGRRQEMRLSRVKVDELLKESCDLIASALPAHVRLDLDLRSSAVLTADAAQVEQVVTNLVLNAADAMVQGGRVTVASFVRGDDAHAELVISVSDDGAGIAPADQELVFEPFFSTKGDQGSGLGLPVSLGIIHQHQGRIELHSLPGQGATFEVCLPLESRTSAGPGTSAADSEAPVVVVDDEAVVRQVLTQMLDLLGISHRLAESPEEGLELVRTLQPRLLITDVVMPGMRGGELATQALAEQPELKVLFVSGFSKSLLEDLNAPEAQCAFLEKPFTVRALEESVRRLLGPGSARAARTG